VKQHIKQKDMATSAKPPATNTVLVRLPVLPHLVGMGAAASGGEISSAGSEASTVTLIG
jgi:hypothetical protein